MKKIATALTILAGSAAVLACSALPASANIIYDSSITALGQGFGAVPRMLTVQENGSDTLNPPYESACDGNSGGSLLIGQCAGADALILGNGFYTPNSLDSVNGGKDALVTLSSVGITNANQIVLVYNPSQEGNDPTTDIIDITLKFYGTNNLLLTSADGGCGNICALTSADPLYFGDTGLNLGNGGTGFGLVLDATQAAAVNTACGVNMVLCSTMALEVTIWNANDGPDSFLLYTKSQTNPIPEPLTLSLFGAGLMGAVALRRKAKNKA